MTSPAAEVVRLTGGKAGPECIPPALLRPGPGGGEVQRLGGPLPPRRVENDLRRNQLAAAQPRDDCAVGTLDRLDRLTEAKGDAESAQVVLQRLDDLLVDEIEYPRPLLDEGHLDAERSGHRRVLEANDAAPDNCERAWNLAQP